VIDVYARIQEAQVEFASPTPKSLSANLVNAVKDACAQVGDLAKGLDNSLERVPGLPSHTDALFTKLRKTGPFPGSNNAFQVYLDKFANQEDKTKDVFALTHNAFAGLGVGANFVANPLAAGIAPLIPAIKFDLTKPNTNGIFRHISQVTASTERASHISTLLNLIILAFHYATDLMVTHDGKAIHCYGVVDKLFESWGGLDLPEGPVLEQHNLWGLSSIMSLAHSEFQVDGERDG
jgi:hypothetical protein